MRYDRSRRSGRARGSTVLACSAAAAPAAKAGQLASGSAPFRSTGGRLPAGNSPSGRIASAGRGVGPLPVAALVAVLLSATVGCGLNSAARPIAVRPDVTSVIIDPVTLKPVTPARAFAAPKGLRPRRREPKPARRDRLEEAPPGGQLDDRPAAADM